MDFNTRFIKNKIKTLPWHFFSNLGLYRDNNLPIKFIVEKADWAIKFVGQNIKNEVDLISPGKIEVTTKPYKIFKSVVHFGSQYMWLDWENHMAADNRFVTSFFHGKYEDGEEVKIHIDSFLKSVERLDNVITASTLVEERLLSWGVPTKKLIKIPLGVDTNLFKLPKKNHKENLRESLGIPKHFILIGSFQKDGSGWKDGLNPKLIKGPDLFVSTLKLLSSRGYPVFALLTGPARGYVKRELSENGIPFFHTFPKDHNELISLYHVLDIYLITSREEGGPLGLLESISCGVPVASTNVGMARDIIIDEVTGVIAERIEVEAITQKVEKLIQMSSIQKNEMKKKARESVSKFDWKIIAKQYWEKIYKPLTT